MRCEPWSPSPSQPRREPERADSLEVSFGGRTRMSGPKHQPEVWSWLDDEPKTPVVRWCVSCTCGFSEVVGDQGTAEGLAEGHSDPDFQKKIEEEKGPEILTTSKGQDVEVVRSDEESVQILAKDTQRREIEGIKISSFSESLVSQWGRGKGKNRLSQKQRAWVHFLAGEVLERAQSRKVEEMVGPELSEERFPRLVEMLVGAKDHLKFPRIIVQMEGGSIRLNVAGERAKVPGSLNVTSDGAFDDREWYGRIHSGQGEFEGSRKCPEWVLGALVEFESDPAKAAALQGQKFGCCCFCSRELITNDSVRVGYGPVCADKYGLPWGLEEGEG